MRVIRKRKWLFGIISDRGNISCVVGFSGITTLISLFLPHCTLKGRGRPIAMASHDALTTNMLENELTDDPFHATTAGDLNFYLQTLLDRKEKQLQQAGNLGQRVLAQQMELEERIRQIQESVIDKPEEEQVDQAARVKYQELSETILAWDAENAQLSASFGASSKVGPHLLGC